MKPKVPRSPKQAVATLFKNVEAGTASHEKVDGHFNGVIETFECAFPTSRLVQFIEDEQRRCC